MKAIMTEEGLLIPKEELDRIGEVVITEQGGGLTIRPKSVVAATRGILSGNTEAAEALLRRIEEGEALVDDTLEAL